jgi:type IV secretory pathway VirJ component
MTKMVPPAVALLAALAMIGSVTLAGPLSWRSVPVSLTTPSDPVHTSLDDDVLGHLEIESPRSTPKALVFLVAGRSNMPERDSYIEALVKAGAIAVKVDFEQVRASLASEPRDEENACHYVSDDFKDAAQTIQRQLGLKTYLFPVIAGIDEGAPLAFVALAQAPDNTLAGAVTLGFDTDLQTDRPYCPGPHMTKLRESVYSFDNATPLPGAWRVIAPLPAQERIEAFQHPFDDARFVVASPDQRQNAFVSAALEVGARGSHGVEDLPLSVIRPKGDTRALAVIISGDGGWRDIDKSIGEWLAYRGVAVVGLDALRYFWSEREPKQVAGDLEAILEHYGREFGTRRYALIGYSFGADVIPFAWGELSSRTKARVVLVSLLGLGADADFEITVDGVLGRATATGRPVAPMLPGLPLSRTQCIFGQEEAAERDTSCTAPEISGAEIIERPGGHHFDGNYDALAARILSRLTVSGE